MLPFEQGAIRKRLCSRAKAGPTSGQASSLCQASVSSASVALVELLDLEARQDAIEILPMQNIELDERPPPAAHLVHARPVFLAPGIREREPVEIMAHRLENSLHFARNAVAPIHHGAECVEDQRLDVGHRQRRPRLAPMSGRREPERAGGHQCGAAAHEIAASGIHGGILLS